MGADIQSFVKSLQNGESAPALLKALGVSGLDAQDLVLFVAELARLQEISRRKRITIDSKNIVKVLDSYDRAIGDLAARSQRAAAVITRSGERNSFVGFVFALGGSAVAIYWGFADLNLLGVFAGSGMGGVGLGIVHVMKEQMIASYEVLAQVTRDADLKLRNMLVEMRELVERQVDDA